MTRLFLPPEDITSKQITIKGEQARYISSVLRLKSGELLAIFDGLGHRYVCKIINTYKKEVLAEIIKEEPYSAESPISIILAQGMPKGDKMDFIVQKATELGVKTIIPVITERSQVRRSEKVKRWRKIALSASQQSGREKIPDITEPVSLKDFLADYSQGIFFSEEEKASRIKTVLKEFKDSTTIPILIGPEGGFSKTEANMALKRGFTAGFLGPRILRTETAAITAISIIGYELGDMG